VRSLPFRSAEDLERAVRALQPILADGGVVVLPTETFYGLAGIPWQAAAVARILAMKGRPPNLALPVLCAGWDQVERLAVVPAEHRRRLERLWPGPLTAVLRCRPGVAASAGGTIAVRIPGLPLLRALLEGVGPLTGTSANRHGHPPATEMAPAVASLLEPPDLALDGGVTTGGPASTVVDLVSGGRVLRPGPVRWAAEGGP